MKRGRRYWLMKSEPTVFSFDDLKARPGATDHWEGVRNYQARNYMREMAVGDLALFYHSNCDPPGVVGVIEIVRTAYPDHTAFDPLSRYYDGKTSPDAPRWYMVDVKWKEAFKNMVTLREMREEPRLQGMKVLQKRQRLSVMPVTVEEYDIIRKMGLRTV